MTTPLPSPAKWNSALEHSRAHPAHILGPYTDDDGRTQMECIGTDPDHPNCDFDTATHPQKASPS